MVTSFISIGISVGTAEASKRKTAWIEGFAIFVAVMVCATVGACNDYQKESQFQKLNQIAEKRKKISVIRNGINQNILESEVMVGDLCIIYEGMNIPADGLVIDASELYLDESAMTGETNPIKKNSLKECINYRNQVMAEGKKLIVSPSHVYSPILKSGTRVFNLIYFFLLNIIIKVLNGEGKFIVIVVGDESCEGKIYKLLRTEKTETTPLQEKLEQIARDIGKFGLISAVLIVLILLIRFTIERVKDQNIDSSHAKEILDFFIIGVVK